MLVLTPMPNFLKGNNLIFDYLDYEKFENSYKSSTNLQHLITKGNKILPYFESFAFDIFLCFFKAEVTFNHEDNDNPASIIYKHFISDVLKSSAFKPLRNQTFLDEFKSSISTMQFINNFFDWISNNDVFSKKALLDFDSMDKAQSRITELNEQQKVIKENKRNIRDKEISKKLNSLELENDMEINRLNSDNSELLKDMKYKLRDNRKKVEDFIRNNLKDIDNKFDQLSDDTAMMFDFDNSTNNGDIGRKIDLADKLVNNKKLKKLSDMLGSLKEAMNKQLNKNWKRKMEELYTVSIGNDIGHTTASEIIKLGNKVLRYEFYKKYIEEQLQQYDLKDKTKKGPFIICLDCSSSMKGDKEVWSKALALTLSGIAGRQRRKCDILAFTSSDQVVKHFDIKNGIFRNSPDQTFLELAEYFPGGGTNFERPLEMALDLTKKCKHKNSDVVFITDGEANVGDNWMENFLREKKSLNIKLFSIFIDLSEKESPQVLLKLSDRVTTINDLTSNSAVDIFSSAAG